MKTFLALYMVPMGALEEWAKVDEASRKEQEQQMMEAWNAWTAKHASAIKDAKGAGWTKVVTKDGTTDGKNGIMVYTIVEAESHEDAAKMFENHPHFTIPGATIEVMTTREMS